jgi:uncharacterized protein YcfJ
MWMLGALIGGVLGYIVLSGAGLVGAIVGGVAGWAVDRFIRKPGDNRRLAEA